MRRWLRDDSFRSLLKNSSYLGASRIVAAAASVITLAFAARALGVILFGLLILIHSYAQAASSLSKFQTWQVVVRYGGEGLASGRPDDFKVATGFAFGLDILSGLVGMIAAMALLPFIGGWFGIPREYIGIAVLYCTVIPTMQAMTPGGVLRTLDRFDLFSWGAVGDPIVRAVLAGLAWAFHAPFEAYVAIWWATDLGGDLYMWWLTHRELRRRGMRDALRPVLNPHPLKGAWRFAIRVNLSSSLSAAWGPIARLIVGGLLGPASAAFYRVAATLSDSAQKPTDMLARAFYPEIMRMDPRTRRPWKLMLRGAAVAAIIGIVALLLVAMAGDLLIDGIFGSKFDPAYPVLAILVIAPVLGAVAFPFEPMLYRLDRSSAPLKARIVATIVYFAIVAPLSLHFEVEGAAAAFVIGNLVFVGLLGLYLWGQYRQIRAGEVPPASAPLIDEQ